MSGLITKVDGSDPSNVYVGEAAAAVTGVSPFWRIQKVVVSGASVSVLWADGNEEFDNVWDDRASLVYS